METEIVPMLAAHWPEVRRIYEEGIATGAATFEGEAPEREDWDVAHLEAARLVAVRGGRVVGWAALAPVSDRCVLAGVAEVSVYVEAAVRGSGIGGALLRRLIGESESAGIWTLQAGIFPENSVSLALHRRSGFREVGVREKIGRLNGEWRDVVLLERRSPAVHPPVPAVPPAGSSHGSDVAAAGAGRLMRAWSRLGEEVEGFRARIRELPVVPRSSPSELRAEIGEAFDLDAPSDVVELVERVAGLLRRGSVQVTSPRYFGLYNPSVLEAGILADALAALYNLQLAASSHAPAAAEMEAAALARYAESLGFDPETTHSNFTAGGAEANHSAVLAALAHRYPSWAEGGAAAIRGSPSIYLSAESHHSLRKVARISGLGTDALREVPVDGRFEMGVEALRRRLDEDRGAGRDPLMVVATAGTTGTGAIDPLAAIAGVAAEYGAWLHVDAAWGGAAVLSRGLRPLLDGIERADSVTWDAHKWLAVPMGAGMFFCRHRAAVARAFATSTGYMPPPAADGVIDGYLSTLQWSRRAIGLKVFMALAQVGRRGYADMVERQTAMGERLREALRAGGWLVLNDARLPVVCFTHPELRGGASTVPELLRALYARGRVWVSEVALPTGERALRACITSYGTDEADIEVLVAELEAARSALP